jgi:hypothetical protein
MAIEKNMKKTHSGMMGFCSDEEDPIASGDDELGRAGHESEGGGVVCFSTTRRSLMTMKTSLLLFLLVHLLSLCRFLSVVLLVVLSNPHLMPAERSMCSHLRQQEVEHPH